MLVHRRHGYTLLELITVIAMMGVLGTLMTSVWFQIMDGWHLTKTRVELDRRVYNAFDQMRQDFDMILSPTQGAGSLEGTAFSLSIPESRSGPRRILLEPNYDVVTFATMRPNIGKDGLLEAQRVTYRVDRPQPGTEGEMVLVRAVQPIEGAVEGVEQVLDVLPAATELRIDYLHEGAWLRNWSRDTLPEAVRVSVTAMVPQDSVRGDTDSEAISRVAVFPVRVQ
jgi:prepilin-type N-terminal cleavage/methylation domain-containing protein